MKYTVNENYKDKNNKKKDKTQEGTVNTDIKMTIDKFLEIAFLDLLQVHKNALKKQYRGKILYQSEWNTVIQTEIHKRA